MTEQDERVAISTGRRSRGRSHNYVPFVHYRVTREERLWVPLCNRYANSAPTQEARMQAQPGPTCAKCRKVLQLRPIARAVRDAALAAIDQCGIEWDGQEETRVIAAPNGAPALNLKPALERRERGARTHYARLL